MGSELNNKAETVLQISKNMENGNISEVLSLIHIYVIDASTELIDRIAQNDMVRGVTIAAGGFFGPQGRELRVPLADPHQNEKIEKFERCV